LRTAESSLSQTLTVIENHQSAHNHKNEKQNKRRKIPVIHAPNRSGGKQNGQNLPDKGSFSEGRENKDKENDRERYYYCRQ